MSNPARDAARLLDGELATIRKKLKTDRATSQVQLEGLQQVLARHADVVAAIERQRRAVKPPDADE